MIVENINEFKTFIQGFINSNSEDTFIKRIHWKGFTKNMAFIFFKSLPFGELILKA